MKRYRKKETAKRLKQLVNLDELKNNYYSEEDEPTDYSDANNWLYMDLDNNHEVDVFYLYPAIFVTHFDSLVTPINDEMKAGSLKFLTQQAGCLGNFTNIYAPYYRQLSLLVLYEYGDNEDKIMEVFKNSVAYADVCQALDIYFTFVNKDRPFILAGHDQGSLILKIVLAEYMKEHPDIYKRMVAAYLLGYSVTRDYFAKNPHLRFAKTKDDIGVIISWNTEGPNAKMDSKVVLQNSVAINPLNWRLDEEPAYIEENFGSYQYNPLTYQQMVVPGLGDAVLDNKRGVVVCKSYKEYLDIGLFGDKSLHAEDWTLFIENIKQNAYDRIATYLGYYPKIGHPLDYADELNWITLDDNPKYPVDTFYIYPTMVESNNGKISSILGTEHVNTAEMVFNRNAGVFGKFTNLFAPLYRQVTFDGASTCNDPEQFCNLIRRHKGLSDIYSALDYYFENCNNGRPYIFVSHSQGSAIVRLILSEYMKKHPDYLKRMIVAYAIGFNFSKEFFKKNPELHFAEGETDTNVIVSWNTEGPNAKQNNIAVGEHGYCINPLNWKTDETLATAEENLGSYVTNPLTGTIDVIPNYVDARVNKKRGSLTCTTIVDYVESINMFGNKSLHSYDIDLYIINMVENAKKRIAAYFEKNQ